MAVKVKTWSIRPDGWSGGPLRVVVIADLHACRPWMGPQRVARIVERAQSLGGDLVALLGDFVGHISLASPMPPAEVAALLAPLKAPLGVWGVQGNHDWYDDPHAAAEDRPTIWQQALETSGIALLENRATELTNAGHSFTLAGLSSQRGLAKLAGAPRKGVDDLEATLRNVDPQKPTILLAHEPDVFPDLPDHVTLTLSGHTHGGQVRLLGWTPVVPSRYGSRYVYGHIVEGRRHLVVSGGLGYTTLPLRIGVPPEITVIEVS